MLGLRRVWILWFERTTNWPVSFNVDSPTIKELSVLLDSFGS